MSALAALILAAALPSVSGEQLVVRRFAFVAAANDGGPTRPRLRYAVTDARSLAGVLEELGGVAAVDQFMVVEPTKKELLTSLDRLDERLLAAREQDAGRIELVFYYSGHSDETGLLLGEETLTYDDLRRRLDGLAADVRIAILDSCASGAITRRKGGKHRPPFLVDASSQVKGYAVLTSSSENEAAQESDRIGASFFTHYLVSGLRGAADVTTDGRVTLNEAYAFAFHETLRRTEKTLGGAQHAAYDIQLVGSGDLVMTDINAMSATLGVPEPLAGRVFVRDADGRLVAELEKPGGRRVALGLSPGRYEVSFQSKRSFMRGYVDLVEGTAVDLDTTQLETVDGEVTALRGDVEPDEVVLVDFGIIPALSLNRDRRVENYFSLSLGWGHSYRLTGVAIAIAATTTSENMTGAQITTAVASAGGYARGAQISAGLTYAGAMDGVQIAGGVNVTSTLTGLQIAAGANWASRMRGIQISSGINLAEDAVGAQLANVNYAGAMSGVQIGLLNIADASTGFQLGLLNFSRQNDGESVGLISYSLEDGILRPSVTSSDIGLATVGLKLGTNHVYTLFSLANAMLHEPDAWAVGMGLGVTVPLDERFRIDIDALTQSAWATRSTSGPPESLNTFRATIGWRLTRWLTLFGGPTYHVLVDVDDVDPEARLRPSYAWRHSDRVSSWLGWSVGIEFLK